MPSPTRVALVTQGLTTGGGVPTVVRWLRAGLEASAEYSVDIHDLATSSVDDTSRRLLKPSTLGRRSLRIKVAEGVDHWGANAVEVEAMRYRPRLELTRALQGYDLIQVVSGNAAIGAVVTAAGPPVVLQVATTATWERASQFSGQALWKQVWRRGMTHATGFFERYAIKSADAVLVENDHMLGFVRDLGQKQVVKAPPGVDTTIFSPSETGWSPDGYLLSVCRLSDRRKGLERLILAYGILTQTYSKVPDLILAGRGSLTGALVAMIRDLGLVGRVSILSDVPSEELPALYRGAAAYLQSSYEEGLGMSILEAMASGLPVVSTLTAGSRELVTTGVSGWLIPQGADSVVASNIASKTLEVLGGAGAHMGASSRERCETYFSMSVTLDRFTAVYATLCSPHGAARAGTR